MIVEDAAPTGIVGAHGRVVIKRVQVVHLHEADSVSGNSGNTCFSKAFFLAERKFLQMSYFK